MVVAGFCLDFSNKRVQIRAVWVFDVLYKAINHLKRGMRELFS